MTTALTGVIKYKKVMTVVMESLAMNNTFLLVNTVKMAPMLKSYY